MGTLLHWMQGMEKVADKRLHLMDLFGASQTMARTFERAGWNAESYDIQLSRNHDITSESGFRTLCKMAVRLIDTGMMMVSPPCSLFVAASASVHCRSVSQPEGAQSNFKVRMSQRIWLNTVAFLMLIFQIRPRLCLAIEQPSSSWGFKQPYVKSLIHLLGLKRILTYMGFFSHDLCKPTHILTNSRSFSGLARKLTKADRARIQARFERRQSRRAVKKVYHMKVLRRDGRMGWQGGRDLSSTASFTLPFCRAVLGHWQESRVSDSPPSSNVISISDSDSD